MTPLDLLVIYGSVRHHRQGIKAARFIVGECKDRGHNTTLVDPMELQLPLLDKMYKEYNPGQAPEVLMRLAGQIKAADAFIIVSGEYNHSIPRRCRTCSTTFWRSTSGGPRRSSAIPPAPSAGCEPPCSCERCCASWARRASPRCSRYRLSKKPLTTKASQRMRLITGRRDDSWTSWNGMRTP